MRQALLAVYVLLLVSSVHGQLKHRALRGEVVFRNNGTDLYNLVVFVDSFAAGQKRDGKVDHIFGLRSEEAYGVVSERLPEAQVTVEAGRVVIYSEIDHRAFVLAVPGYEQVDWLTSETGVRTFLGHSMVANEGAFGLTSTELREGALTSSFTPPGDPMGGSGSCTAGGPGSSFCSVSCRAKGALAGEVTCTGRNYACCACDTVTGVRCKCLNGT
ncbi:MAG TPA: hypothetical protein VF432_33210 [Thermoanaerobaculia bacterium]